MTDSTVTPRAPAQTNSGYPNFGLHAVTFLGFLYASILSSTIPILDSTTNLSSFLTLVLFWFYLGEDWLLKYSAWKGIESIAKQNDEADGVINRNELLDYYQTSLLNFLLLFVFLICITVAFYARLTSINKFLNEIVLLSFSLSLLIGWIWNVFVSTRYSLGKKQLPDLFKKTLTLRGHTLEIVKNYYLDVDDPISLKINSFKEAIDCIRAASRICARYALKWLLIHIFLWMTLIIKFLISFAMLIGFVLQYYFSVSFFDCFNLGCFYMFAQLIVDLFTLKLISVPPKRA